MKNNTMHFSHSSPIAASQQELFEWHQRKGAFTRLNPPWAPVSVLSKTGESLAPGTRVTLRVPLGLGISQVWEHLHTETVPPAYFKDIQSRGPFTRWEHTHSFSRQEDNASTLTDEISFDLPGGKLAELVAGRYLHRSLLTLFRYRHTVTQTDLSVIKEYPVEKPLTVAISGAGGTIGRQLSAFLECAGHRVLHLVRRPPRHEGEIEWNLKEGITACTTPFDVLIHLAADSIGEGRWTSQKKENIRRSRVEGTYALLSSLHKLHSPPSTVLCASAIGIYGSQEDTLLSETSKQGEGFLSEVGRAWEEAAHRALSSHPTSHPTIRPLSLRFGIILTPEGGALQKMLPPFRFGVGGPLGSGTQWMSWIHLHDAIYAIYHLIMKQDCRGAYNIVAPNPATNREFSSVLAHTLHRPCFAAVPGTILRLLLGEVAEALLLSSTKVAPQRLTESGFRWRYPTLSLSLSHMLGEG